MQAEDLISHIEKYHLGKLVESVAWTVDNGIAKVKFISMFNSTAGYISFPFVDIGSKQFGIFNTSSFLRMLNAMDGDISISFEEEHGILMKMIISDGSFTGSYSLASVQSISPAPDIKDPKAFDVSFKIDDCFIKQFNDAYKAIEGVERFTIGADKTINVILGNRESYSNKIKFTKTSDDFIPMKPLPFSAESLYQIVRQNYGDEGTLEVSSEGLMKISYQDRCYYIVELEEV